MLPVPLLCALRQSISPQSKNPPNNLCALYSISPLHPSTFRSGETTRLVEPWFIFKAQTSVPNFVPTDPFPETAPFLVKHD